MIGNENQVHKPKKWVYIQKSSVDMIKLPQQQADQKFVR